MNDDVNPNAVIGGNRPPLARSIASEENFAAHVTAFLEEEYRDLFKSVSELLDEARALPESVDGDAVMGEYAKIIKRLRDTDARAEAFRVKEVEPYLRGQQAVNAIFFSTRDKIRRRASANRAGVIDILSARLDDYNQRKLAAEQERRRVAAELEARLAREAQAKAAREAAAAEEARLAAERARKPETTAAKGAAASAAEQQASASRVEAAISAERAQDAHIATLAKPADIVRTRVESGPLVTMGAKVWAEVTDSAKLDKEKLWAFIPEATKAQALRAWAKNTGYTVPMDGADIGKGQKSRVV